MSAPESTAVIAPPAPPAPAPVTVEHISALHRRINELEGWLSDKLHELFYLVERAAPVVEKVGSAVASSVPGVGPLVASVEKVVEVVSSCPHPSAHAVGCTCAKTP